MIELSKIFHRRKREIRESYTNQIVARIMASASGASDGRALAAIETASRVWGSGLASAAVSPSEIELAAITPSVLDAIGRSLCRTGESLFVIDVRGGRLILTPTASWTVQGDPDPASWRYLCTLNGPSTARTITLPGESVLHVRYAPSPSQPWKGRSPMQMAIDTARAAGLLEHATSEEFSFVQRQLLSPRRNRDNFGITDSLTPDVIDKIVQAFAESTGTGALVVPGDLEPRRLGPEPPSSFPPLREQLEHSLLAMHGIPPSLVAEQGTGTALREANRQVLLNLLNPLGALVAEELRAKLHPDAALSFDSLQAGDITGRARAVGSLTTAGMSIEDARAVAGL